MIKALRKEYFERIWREGLADVSIFRTTEDKAQTTGFLILKDDFISNFPPFFCYTLELPWRENKRNVSRIPPGTFGAMKYFSPKFKRTVILLQDVPGRSGIEIHPGNTHEDITGCILVGLDYGDINRDGAIDLKDSRKVMDRLLSLFPDKNEFNVKIFDCFNKEN